MSHPIDNRLRPAVEFIPAVVSTGCMALALADPGMFLMPPIVATAAAAGFTGLAAWRASQGLDVLRYRRNLRRLPRYSLSAPAIPVSRSTLFLGRGFRWHQTHTQRVFQAREPESARWVQPGRLYRAARQMEIGLEDSRLLGRVCALTSWDSPLNPVRPLPPVGGDPMLHGVGMEDEQDVHLPLGERVGHALVLGTTRVGKTRLAEMLITQDIRRGDVVIVFDPKGDKDLLRRVYAEAKRAGRLDELCIFHLGYPDISCRYNPVGDFGRITEVAGRTTGPLPAEGSSAAFKAFAWRFTNSIARALVALGRKPDYGLIMRYVTNIEALFIEYAEHWLDRSGPQDWRGMVQKIEGAVGKNRDLLQTYKGRGHHAIALAEYLLSMNHYDPVLDSLRGAFTYDRTYFDKITASLLPLLEKLTAGRTAELLAPDYADTGDGRPILDWKQVIRRRGIVYVGLDALSDAEVASAVGNAMFADLTSVAGHLYKFGQEHGLPPLSGDAGGALPRLAIHADEFNELVGDEFVPMVNKAGGAGYQVTVYTQTISDIEARFGSRAKAGQVIGNLGTLIMLRVKNVETAKILTDQLPTVRVIKKIAASGTTDSNDPSSSSEFTSRNEDRLTETEADMLSPADLVQLPKGQAFALLEGGQLWKLRMPLADNRDDPCWPPDVESIVAELARRYRRAA
ncbi:MAG: type IV conjugative transfer system coupling protein TraD [Pseudomonadota bacterium]